MSGSTHIAFGGLAGAGILLLAMEYGGVSAGNPLPFLFFGVLGGMVPDLDATESKIKYWKPIPGVHFRPFYLPSLIVGLLFAHRAFFHSLFAGALISGMALLYWPDHFWLVLSFFGGFFSHLFADSLNCSGIAYFWPIKKRFCLWWSRKSAPRVGGVIDHLLQFGAWVGIAWTLFKTGSLNF
jgi:membrane-bound metal-dependent hydrolase YbcI (DUF457 family)